MKRATPSQSTLAIAVALAAAILAIYWQAHSFEFINFDDNLYVPQNPHINGGLTRAGILWAFSTIDYFYWQPLTWISHMLDCQLFGLRAGWHHLTNVLIHILNTLLVFLVFRRMTGAQWRSAAVAGLFALHPLRVESVAWIAERKDVLSCFWFLVALGAYVYYVERPSSRRYRFVMLAMLLGLMAKPMLVTVPFLFLLVDYWPLRRFAPAEKVPMLYLAGVASLLTCLGTHRMGAMDWAANLSMRMRISNSLVSYVRYLGKTFWPHNLAIFYPYPSSIPAWQVGASVLLLAAITGLTIWAGRSRRYLVAGWFWFLIGLLPAIGIVQVGRQAMADRFVYIPLIGLFAAVVWGTEELLREHRRILAVGSLAVLSVCGWLSWKQVALWHDSVTVFAHALSITEDNSTVRRQLGAGLAEHGRTEAAIAQLAEAVRIEPKYFIAHYDYGSALLQKGDLPGAAGQFTVAIRYRANYGDAYYKLGKTLNELGRSQEALPMVEEALRVGLSDENTPAATALLASIGQR